MRYLIVLILSFSFAASALVADDDWYSDVSAASKAAPSPSRPDIITKSLKCSICYASLNPYYKPFNTENLKNISARIRNPLGYTMQEARNFYEAFGGYLAEAVIDTSEAAMKAEKKELFAVVREGKYYFGNVIANVGTGTTDCLTHAERLKEYLEEHYPAGSKYHFEIVNGWSDPSKYSAGNVLGANHFMVRAVSSQTGHSYICDGYVLCSVVLEKDSSYLLFNDFEDCIYNNYVTMTVGEGALRIIAQWTPVQKGLMAQRGKSGAAVCLTGAEKWTFEK